MMDVSDVCYMHWSAEILVLTYFFIVHEKKQIKSHTTGVTASTENIEHWSKKCSKLPAAILSKLIIKSEIVLNALTC